MWLMWFILICIIFFISVGVKESNDKMTSGRKIRAGYGNHYNYIKNKYDLFEDLPSSKCISGFGEIKKAQGCYIFKKEDSIYLCGIPSENNIIDQSYFNNELREFGTETILVDNVEYFRLIGEQLAVTKGEGGGSSLGGALLGSAVAGGAGAIVASRKKTNISTEVLDKRKTILVYNNPITNSVEHIAFSPNAYDLFLKLIPDRELGYIQNKK